MAKPKTTNDRADDEDSRPLLGSAEDDHAGNSIPKDVVFSVDDDDEDEEELYEHIDDEAASYPRSGPPLKSTIQSREAQFELDPDVLDESEYRRHLRPSELDMRRSAGSGGRDGQRSMPLLVGLLESSGRRSLDLHLQLPLAVDGDDEMRMLSEELDLDEVAKRKDRGGGMVDSIANMANSILGAGIIGLPYALSRAGFFTGVILLIILCGVTDWTIRLIVRNAKLSGRTSYIDIMDHCFGYSGRAFVSVFQFGFAFGGMCAFGIIIGDTIPHVIRSVFPNLHNVPVLSFFTNRQFVIAFCTVCISYPLSLYRDIHKLSRASGFALVGMLIIVGSVLFEGQRVSKDLKGDPSKRFTIIQPGIFEAIGVISFAFVCHHNSLLIYGSLRTPTLDRFALVTHISTLMSLLCCTLMAVSAYIVFTDKTQGNILNNFSANDTLINVARFCFGLNMFTTLPLELFVCREVVEQFFFSHEPFSQHRHVLFTTSILFASMLMSMITCDLGVMLELTGGISATALAFIFPAACYIKLSDPAALWNSRAKLPSYVCVAFGFTVMVISSLLAIGKSFGPTSDEHKVCV